MQDVDVSGQSRFWVNKATFLRVNFHDNVGLTGYNRDPSNGGLLTVQGGGAYKGRANITDCTFKNSKAQKGGCLSNYMGHMNVTNCVFDSCEAEEAGAILNHGVMRLVNATFINNTATSPISKGASDNAGADCVCVPDETGGVGRLRRITPDVAAAQCFGCTPAENTECHKADKLLPGQPDYYCPGPKPHGAAL